MRNYIGRYHQVISEDVTVVVEFRITVEMDARMNFNGSAWEAEFSRLSGKELTVRGFVDGEHISFVKTYPCGFTVDAFGQSIILPDERGHEVLYDGYWDHAMEMWTGEWEVEGETLVFSPTEIKVQVFTGYFEMKMEA
jgi:hypothetical protein